MFKIDNHKVDFLGIGVQKAATSWLWQNLRKHPDIWMPPRKELHYFDRSTAYPSPSFLSSKYLIHRLFGRERHNKHFRRQLARGLGSALISLNWNILRWNLSYFLSTVDDEWYLSLFEKGKGKIWGEITPSYSILDLKDIRRIREFFPDIKIILILRNPVDRAWSHVRFEWTQRRIKEVHNMEQVIRFLEAPGQTMRGDYNSILVNWMSCIPDKQFYIGFYEDVIKDPDEFLFHIFNFLGVDASLVPGHGNVNQKANVSKTSEIPGEIKLYLAKKYHQDLIMLSQLIGGYSKEWLDETEMILQEHKDGDQI